MTRIICTEGDRHVLYECDICGGLHPWSWNGDCRDDDNRYGDAEEYADAHGIHQFHVDVRSMECRLAADGG